VDFDETFASQFSEVTLLRVTFNRGGVSLETEKGKRGTTSKLLITRAQLNDSGNYTCASSKVTPASVMVHVLNGEQNTGSNIGIVEVGVATGGLRRLISKFSTAPLCDRAREKRNVLHCEITPRARFAIRTYICFNSHSQSPRFLLSLSLSLSLSIFLSFYSLYWYIWYK